MNFDILFTLKDPGTGKPISGEGIFEWDVSYVSKEVKRVSDGVSKRVYSTPLNVTSCSE